jgi:hypothetical protein
LSDPDARRKAALAPGLAGDHLEAEDVGVEVDGALDIADEQDGVVEPDDLHDPSRRTTYPNPATATVVNHHRPQE